jgi:mannose-6-phosphate isomerase-like protein (cupin superfamily)
LAQDSEGAIAMTNYEVVHFDDIEAVRCPCGHARRAFAAPDNSVATLHIVDSQTDSKAHYHKGHTELYLVLEGEGHIELDGQLVPARPYSAIMIKPLCRHRAVGTLRFVNVCIPPFDPADEWFD